MAAYMLLGSFLCHMTQVKVTLTQKVTRNVKVILHAAAHFDLKREWNSALCHKQKFTYIFNPWHR